jgi:uncharacterized membrane protein YfcA
MKHFYCALAGVLAGTIAGLFGAGGGMVLVPLLGMLTDLEDRQVFPASVGIILPVCLVSLSITFQRGVIPWNLTLPYLLGSAAGGILAGIFGRKIPTVWLHRMLGILILWGGFRYLC